MNAWPYVRLNLVYLRILQNSTEIHVIIYILFLEVQLLK